MAGPSVIIDDSVAFLDVHSAAQHDDDISLSRSKTVNVLLIAIRRSLGKYKTRIPELPRHTKDPFQQQGKPWRLPFRFRSQS
jgi:hypothetical protein